MSDLFNSTSGGLLICDHCGIYTACDCLIEPITGEVISVVCSDCIEKRESEGEF